MYYKICVIYEQKQFGIRAAKPDLEHCSGVRVCFSQPHMSNGGPEHPPSNTVIVASYASAIIVGKCDLIF